MIQWWQKLKQADSTTSIINQELKGHLVLPKKKRYQKRQHNPTCKVGGDHYGTCKHPEDVDGEPLRISSKTKTKKAKRPKVVKKSGSGRKTTKKTEKTKKVSMGDLEEQPMAVLVYEVDDGINIVGFANTVDTVNVNYVKWEFDGESSYDDGDLILHWKDTLGYQIHTEGVGSEVAVGDEYWTLQIPRGFDYKGIDLQSILDYASEGSEEEYDDDEEEEDDD